MRDRRKISSLWRERRNRHQHLSMIVFLIVLVSCALPIIIDTASSIISEQAVGSHKDKWFGVAVSLAGFIATSFMKDVKTGIRVISGKLEKMVTKDECRSIRRNEQHHKMVKREE